MKDSALASRMRAGLTATQGIRLTRENSKITIILDNPAVSNRLGSDNIQWLRQVIAEVNCDSEIRVMVFTGRGACFSSGFDLNELANLVEAGNTNLPLFQHLTDELEQVRCPTICALNGSVYGGAIDLALACDFRVGVTGSEMVMPAARIGLHYYPNGIRRYVSRLGVAGAKRLFVMGQAVQGEEMRAIGFLDDLVEPGQLNDRVNEWVGYLCAGAPLAVEGMKMSINHYTRAIVDDGPVLENYRKCMLSEELHRRLQRSGRTAARGKGIAHE